MLHPDTESNVPSGQAAAWSLEPLERRRLLAFFNFDFGPSLNAFLDTYEPVTGVREASFGEYVSFYETFYDGFFEAAADDLEARRGYLYDIYTGFDSGFLDEDEFIDNLSQTLRDALPNSNVFSDEYYRRTYELYPFVLVTGGSGGFTFGGGRSGVFAGGTESRSGDGQARVAAYDSGVVVSSRSSATAAVSGDVDLSGLSAVGGLGGADFSDVEIGGGSTGGGTVASGGGGSVFGGGYA